MKYVLAALLVFFTDNCFSQNMIQNHTYQPADMVGDLLNGNHSKYRIAGAIKKRLSIIKNKSVKLLVSEERVYSYSLDSKNKIVISLFRMPNKWELIEVNNKIVNSMTEFDIPLTDEGLEFRHFITQWNNLNQDRIVKITDKKAFIRGIYISNGKIFQEGVFHFTYKPPTKNLNQNHGWVLTDLRLINITKKEFQDAGVQASSQKNKKSLAKHQSIDITQYAPPIESIDLEYASKSNNVFPIVERMVCDHKKEYSFFRISLNVKNLNSYSTLIQEIDIVNRYIVLNALPADYVDISSNNCTFFGHGQQNNLLTINFKGFEYEIQRIIPGKTTIPYFDFHYSTQ